MDVFLFIWLHHQYDIFIQTISQFKFCTNVYFNANKL